MVMPVDLGVAARKRRVSVLGATGSVGLSTIDLLRRNRDTFEIVALTAGKNVASLVNMARELRPELAVIADDAHYEQLCDALDGTGIEVASGTDAVIDAASRDADWVMAAIVGAAGLASTFAAARQGATVALANKESLVAAGDLLNQAVRNGGGTLLPVDSEHSAIFQVFEPDNSEQIVKLTLTASGGPFRTWPRERIATATRQDALIHPNFDMGAKITIDSATMMNKGFELIEAHHLFSVGPEKLEVLVHPQQIIHSLVSYADGSTLAQLGAPDMRTPIAYAMAWPERMHAPIARLDLASIARLDFEAPDVTRFPALRLARQALLDGGGAPAALSAANEIAVSAFLQDRLKFLEIAEVVERTLDRLGARNVLGAPVDLDGVLYIDGEARRLARDVLGQWG